MLSGAAPSALSAYGRLALSLDDELALAGRRLSSVGSPLAAYLARLAASSAVVDRWVARVGGAFALADEGPIWVDRLSDGEATSVALALGRELAPSLRRLSAADRQLLASAFFPLWLRVRSLWPAAVMTSSASCVARPARPAGLDEALDVLQFPDRSRRTDVVTGFMDGLVLGEFDQRGFDNAPAEWARVIGHAVSGFFAVGDARDLAADVVHADWLAALLDALALVPVAGDALKVGREGINALDAVHDAERSVIDLAGHADRHVGKSMAEMEGRLAAAPRLQRTSTFPDWSTAQAAANEVVAGRADEIAGWLATAGPKPKAFSLDLGRPTGRLLERGTRQPVVVTGVRLVLVRDATLAAGFRVVSAFPVR